MSRIADKSPTHAECFDERGIYFGWAEWLPKLGGWNVVLSGCQRGVFTDLEAVREFMERNGAMTIRWIAE